MHIMPYIPIYLPSLTEMKIQVTFFMEVLSLFTLKTVCTNSLVYESQGEIVQIKRRGTTKSKT